MTKIAFLRVSAVAAGLIVAAQPTFAAWGNWYWYTNPGCDPGTTYSVPEIDASSGLLALAAIGAAMLFAWERRRKA